MINKSYDFGEAEFLQDMRQIQKSDSIEIAQKTAQEMHKTFQTESTQKKTNKEKSIFEEPNGSDVKHSKTINYPESYLNISSNFHLLRVMTNPLKLKKQVYESRYCRSIYALNMLRMFLFQIAIISTQGAKGVAIAAVLVVECAKISLTSILYVKTRHYKSIIYYLLDISQSIFFTLFISMMVYVPKDNIKYDRISIYSVILSSVCDHTLTAIYVVYMIIHMVSYRRSTRMSSAFKQLIEKVSFIYTHSRYMLCRRSLVLA